MATATEEGAARRTKTEKRDVTINVRASAHIRDLIDRAAGAVGKSRSEFMLESARSRAQDVLLDQTVFTLDGGKYDALLKILDKPPAPPDRLRRLLAAEPPWET